MSLEIYPQQARVLSKINNEFVRQEKTILIENLDFCLRKKNAITINLKNAEGIFHLLDNSYLQINMKLMSTNRMLRKMSKIISIYNS